MLGAAESAASHPERARSVWRLVLFWIPALVYAVWRWLELEGTGALKRVFFAAGDGFIAESAVFVLLVFALIPAGASVEEIRSFDMTAPLVVAAMFVGVGLLMYADITRAGTRNHVVSCVEATQAERPAWEPAEIVALCFDSEHDGGPAAVTDE